MASFIPSALLAKLTSTSGEPPDSSPQRRRSRTIVVPRGYGDGVPGMIESYAVGRELGRGAQGRVYEAYSTLSRKFVAIKQINLQQQQPERLYGALFALRMPSLCLSVWCLRCCS